MISETPWILLVAAMAALLGLFIVLKSLKMPDSFEENRKKRDQLRKKVEKGYFKLTL